MRGLVFLHRVLSVLGLVVLGSFFYHTLYLGQRQPGWANGLLAVLLLYQLLYVFYIRDKFLQKP